MHNKKLVSIVAIFAAAIAVFSAANFARAADSNLVITEVMYNSSEKANWIEIYNPSDKDINLVPGQRSKTAPISWKIKIKYIDKKGSPGESNCTFTNSQATLLAPKEYLIISTKPEDFSFDPLIKIFKVSSCFSLATDYQETSISLSDDYGLHWFSEMTYSPSQNKDDSEKSLERKILTDENSWEPSCKNGGTPGEEPNICETEKDPPEEETSNNAADESTKCAASSANIKINEVFPYPSSGDEFVEITNTGADCVDVSGWKVMDEAGHKKTFPENSILESGKYLYLEGNLYLNNDSDTAYLLDGNGSTKNDALDKVSYEKTRENYSYALSDGSFSWTSTPTPGEKNVITAPEVAEKNTTKTNSPSEAIEYYTSGTNVYLNEILPNPKDGSDGEYIEIANSGAEPVDLFGWRIKDASKSKGYQFKDHTILNPGEYLEIYRPDSKISLNNSDESIYLYNPQNEIASSVSFAKSIKNASYNFDGKTWKWSKYLTPGEEKQV